MWSFCSRHFYSSIVNRKLLIVNGKLQTINDELSTIYQFWGRCQLVLCSAKRQLEETNILLLPVNVKTIGLPIQEKSRISISSILVMFIYVNQKHYRLAYPNEENSVTFVNSNSPCF